MSSSSSWDREEMLEPKKFDPSSVQNGRTAKGEDVLLRYKSQAGKNPYAERSTYRDSLEKRQLESLACRPRSPLKMDKNVAFDKEVEAWVLPSPTTAVHPYFRNTQVADLIPMDGKDPSNYYFEHRDSQSPRVLRHKRSASMPTSPSPADIQWNSAAKPVSGMTKSLSDSQFFPPKSEIGRKERRPVPKPLNFPSRSSEHGRLACIDEKGDFAMNYKLEVRANPGADEKVIRSPLKRFFGERGLLGRSPGPKDTPDPRYKKTGLAQLGGKLKQRVGGLSKDLSGKMFSMDLASAFQDTSPTRTSTFPVTLGPFAQADVYMQLELLLTMQTSDFLIKEFHNNRVSLASVKTITETWTKKGRPQVIGFSYDFATQRELVFLNADTMQFGGINALNKVKTIAVLACWKVLAKEMSVRTFCQPDSAVRKHLHDAEKIFELIDATYDTMLTFRQLRNRVISEMCKEESAKHERRKWEGLERSVDMAGLE